MIGKKKRIPVEDAEAEHQKQPAESKRRFLAFPHFRKKAGTISLEEGATTVLDVLAPETVDRTHGGCIIVDGVYHSYLYIAGYGYATTTGRAWLAPLVELGEGISLSFRVVRQSREKVLSSISQSTMWSRSRLREVGDTRQDYEELNDAIHAGLYLKEGMNRGGEDFYYMYTLIEVTANNMDTLEQRVTTVETLCTSIDMIARRCTFQQEQGFLSFLPLLVTDPDIERKSRRNALTFGVAAAFPFASYELSDRGGIFLGLNLYNRSPVLIDPFNDYKYTNGNLAIFGSSGAGKSFTLQTIGCRLRQQGKRIICVVPEKGHEYRKRCEELGGAFIRLAPSSPDCINVLEIRPSSLSAYALEGGLAESLLADKINKVVVWYSLLKKELDENDRNYLDASLVECFGRFGITFDNSSVYEADGVTVKKMPTIPDWYRVLDEKTETRHLTIALTRFVTGSAASKGGQTNIDTKNSYMVLDATGTPEDLLLPTIYTATEFATDLIMESGAEGSALLEDELWKLLGANSNPLAADYTMRMVKIIRSLGGVAITSSQGMADMFALEGGKYGKGILDSSRIKLVMQLEEQEARLVQEKLNLTEEEVRMITRFHRGEGLLCIGHNHVPIAFHASKKEYDAITTSPTDRRARLQQQENGGVHN